MAGAVNTTYTFTATDVITSTKMNNIIDETVMTSDAIIGSTLAISTGKLRVNTSGITANELATGSVTTTAILDANVTTAKIADNAVTTAKISDSGITTAKIADDAVTTAKVLDANITTAKIADAGVTAEKLSGAQSGSAPIYAARAWVSFNGTTGTTVGSDFECTINDSGNVSKVVRSSTGVFVVHFTTPMSDTDYLAVPSSDSNAQHKIAGTQSKATGTVTIAYSQISTGTARINPVNGGVIIFG